MGRASGWRPCHATWRPVRGAGRRHLRAWQPRLGGWRRRAAPAPPGLGAVPRGTWVPVRMASLQPGAQAAKRASEGPDPGYAAGSLGARTGRSRGTPDPCPPALSGTVAAAAATGGRGTGAFAGHGPTGLSVGLATGRDDA